MNTSQLVIYIILIVSVSSVVGWSSLDPTSSSRCVQPCLNGAYCLNATCRCTEGWTGNQCQHCHGRVRLNTSTSGFVTDGPSNYSASSQCTWLIDGGLSLPVRLRLEHFVTECSWDHVYIYDGDGVYGEQLAAFSGSIADHIEVEAKSGKALVYFYSDLAYNMSGFNISYSYNRCPNDCSKHGTCTIGTGLCVCKPGYTGAACDIQLCDACPNCCQNSGACINSTCQCRIYHHGQFCQWTYEVGVWDRIVTMSMTPSPIPHGRASHASVVIGDQWWIVGGMYFSGVAPITSAVDVIVYDFTRLQWIDNKASIIDAPPNRYDHTVVYRQGKIYMFGGVVGNVNITNELWMLDTEKLQWSLISDGGNDSSNAVPIAVAGHTAHVIDNRSMLVIFGYNTYHGYVYKVQEYSFVTQTWSIHVSSGVHVLGRFGHTSVVYRKDKHSLILVHGGYNAPDQSYSYTITDQLYLYNVTSRFWRRLDPSGTKVFRHAAVLINGIMMVIGGNSHNESTPSRPTECYSGRVMAYDTVCDTWFMMKSPTIPELQRYGHSAVLYKNQVFVFGGFNGQMLDSILRFDPANCSAFNRQQEPCQEANEGIKCDYRGDDCLSIADSSLAITFMALVKNEVRDAPYCPMKQILSDELCMAQRDCRSCTDHRCLWCGDGRCSLQACDGGISDIQSCPSILLPSPPRPCSYVFDCFTCRELAHCRWQTVVGKDVCISLQDQALLIEEQQKRQEESGQPSISALSGTLINLSNETCEAPCALQRSCSTCVSNQCMWCTTMRRCATMDAYMISFPYGQCQSWLSANTPNACKLDPGDCKVQKTCADCQSVGPRCGWCDDGSGTGLGECQDGSLSGPIQYNDTEDTCPSSRWYFTDCPACQCNGHSSCISSNRAKSLMEKTIGGESMTCKQPCANQTTGDQCQFCSQGYFGDARNGGICSKCQCNNQATDCDKDTGDCFCTTKGVSGAHCDKCEPKYFGNPTNNHSCYYELAVDFIFTFKLDDHDPKDKYVNRINFFSRPYKKDTDVSYSIVCESGQARVNLSMMSDAFVDYPNRERRFLANQLCTQAGIKRTFSAGEPDFEFGTDANTTFLVYVHSFETPVKIQISFAQSPPINWVLFFVIFAACFIVLLVVAGLLWMIKLRIDVYRRRQRMYVEIEQMASRPFAAVRLHLTTASNCNGATPISVEACSNYRAAVFTVAVRLPTGGRKYTPNGTSGLAVASSLCQLTQAQLALLQAPDSDGDPKHKQRKQRLTRFCPFTTSTTTR